MNAWLMAQRESGRNLLAWLKRAAAVMLLALFGLMETDLKAAVALDEDWPPIRMAASLWGPWQATLDPQDTGEREGYFKPDFAAQGWKDVNVPASFANVAPEIDRYEGVGWFRKSVRLQAQWKDWRVALAFKGVNNHAKIGLLAMCEIPLYMWPGLREGLDNYHGTVEAARQGFLDRQRQFQSRVK